MSDDLDDLIRAAMKTLDEQVPSGYFEALPNQTLARLEGTMQSGQDSRTESRKPGTPQAQARPPVSNDTKDTKNKEERDEDSGLHDIRNLAASARMRMSGKRIGTNPPSIEDDAIASSSGSFKNIALPQPAKMVSLPELAELPVQHEVVSDKRSKKEAKKEAKQAKQVETPLADVPAASPATSSRFTLPSQQRKSSKGPLIVILGLGVAAAAGGVIWMQMNKSEDTAPSAAAQDKLAAAQPASTTTAAVATGSAAAQPAAEPPKDQAAVAGAAAPADATVTQIASDTGEGKAEATPPATTPEPTKTKGTAAKPSKGGKKEKQAPPEKTEVKAPEQPKPEVKTETPKKAPKEGDPDFDALLKEAGVQDKKEKKPTLDKKELTGDDFKKGISAVEGRAKACYKGTQGTAIVKLIVSPNGQVSKISSSGDFAGKPEGACVESAIKRATFPPWDGPQKSFTYTVLLSD